MDETLKAAVVSDSRRRGGAALATARVFDELARREGWDVRWFVSQADGAQDKNTIVFTSPGMVRMVIQTLAGGQKPWCRRLSWRWASVRNRRNLIRLIRQYAPSIISLHSINQWTNAALRRTVAVDLCEIAPTVWTLHDMWPLTGYSDYPDEYVEPTLPADEAWNRVFEQPTVQQEAAVLRGSSKQLVWVAPSNWIRSLAARQFDGMRLVSIPHGVSLQDFRPLPQDEARRWLDIPAGEPVIAAAASSLHARRKGMRLLAEALERLRFPITVTLMGNLSHEWTWPSHVRVVNLGYLSDVRLQRAAYSAADVFVIPSLAEMFGLVVIEAMACGTPCVGFETGGIAETIREGQTGYLAPRGDAGSLAQAIEKVLRQSPQEKGVMRAACRRLVEEEYDLRMEAQRYADLFSELVR